MKALTGPSMYPGTTFSYGFLLCVVLFSSVHGNTYQKDAPKAWKNSSDIFRNINTYGENDRANLPSSQNDSTKLPLLYDENNIMEREHSSNNDDDVTYNNKYEAEPHPTSELKTMVHQMSLNNVTTSNAIVKSSEVRSPDNSSAASEVDGTYFEQFDAYYYYEEYDNDTTLDFLNEKSNDSASDEIIKNSTKGEPRDYSDSDNSTYHSTFYDNFTDSDLYDSDEGTSMESSRKHYVVATNSSSKHLEKSTLVREPVVSVVTSKSVVNGTISIPVTPLPQTTEQISPPPSSSEFMNNKPLERHQTTENSIVVASVQTSRSISGARYLPFPVVEQVVQVAQNVKSTDKASGPLESTESIIDKLDRVQSELSSGFLSGGFRNSGNTLQLDVLPETQGRKSRTTTMRTPVIRGFVPYRAGYSTNRKPLPLPRSPVIPSIPRFNRNETKLNNTITTGAKSVVMKSPQLRPPTDKTSSDGAKQSVGRPKGIVVQDVSAFLPPGFDLDKAKDEPTERSILDDILAKAKVDISSLLPSDYQSKQNATSDDKKSAKPMVENPMKISQLNISSLLPPGYNPKPSNKDAGNTTSKRTGIEDLFTVSKVNIASLLPPGFNLENSNASDHSNKKNETDKELPNQENTTTQATVSTTKAGGLKIVFPSRPGGRKPIHRITTPSTLHGHAPGGFKPAIHKGWPTRATTEFTGWPTSSTTPISIEKLLEAARTATAQSDNAASTPSAGLTSSTTTTTTTTTTPRPTTPGICEEECEVAGTIRLVGNTVWVPELLDSNTIEWKQLANEVEKEIDSTFTKSSTLKKWYKKIRIDAFSQGSILVDYFVELNEIGKRINTQELKTIFHDSLDTYTSSNDNSSESDNLLVLGAFTIDPVSTDFVVVHKSAVPQPIDNENTLIPQWAIAVIVIGVGGLLFIIVFGVSVLVNRSNVAKMKPTMPIYDEEIEKNIIHKAQASPGRRSIDYPKEDLYNIDTDWNDKSFDSRSNKMMVDGPYHDSSRYNLYDSWKSEWNGYYQNSSHASNRSPGYESTANVSRHHPDYDTNF